MNRENRPHISEVSYSINYSQDEAPETGRDIPYTIDTVKDYLRNIGRVPLLNAEQEVELAKRIESGLMAERIKCVRESEDREGELTLIHQQIVAAAEKKLGGGTNDKNKADDEKTEAEVQTQKLTVAKTKPKKELTPGQKATAIREADAGVAIIAKYADDKTVTTEELQDLIHIGVRARRHLVAANLRLVVNLARNYIRSSRMPFIEIIQEGNIGLDRAAKKFDYAKGYKFSTYSTWWIRQAITRAIADQSRTIRLPNYMYGDIKKMDKTRRELTAELNREPTEAEIATQMHIPVTKVNEMRQYASLEPVSLNQLVGESGGRGQTDTELVDILVSNNEPSVDDNVWHLEMKQGVQALLATLDARTALVFKLRHGVDCERPHTLDEIAHEIGVTRERVRQIEKKAADLLRQSALADDMRDLLRDA